MLQFHFLCEKEILKKHVKNNNQTYDFNVIMTREGFMTQN
jgi:hypothetical protein